MKHRFLLVAFITLISIGNRASAQLVTDNAFLQGRWLEACIGPSGCWGNTVVIPAGYHHRGGASHYFTDPILGTTASGDGMDFSYDAGHDGWTTGTDPWYGAYFLPGTPFDGWSVQLNDTMTSAFYSSGSSWSASNGGYDTTLGGVVRGTVTAFNYYPATCVNPQSSQEGIWQGTVGLRRAGMRTAMAVTQTNTLDTNASWMIVTTKFVNTTDSILRGIYYMATADPDNDEVLSGGSFPTNNHIAYQGDAYNRHEVWARPPSLRQDCFSGLASKDCRAKVLIYVSWPPSMTTGNSLDRVWAGTTTGMSTCYYALGATTYSQDIAYGIVFNVGDLGPHDSSIISYAWIFSDTSAIDSAFPGPRLVTEGVIHDNNRPDSVLGCTMAGCGVSGNSFTADILNGNNRDWSWAHWSWAPATGLSSTSGVSNTINTLALSGPTTYTITGTKDTTHGRCLGADGVKTFILYVQPCFSATSNAPICMNDTLKLFALGDSTGATYYWFGPAGFSAFGKNVRRYPLTMADTGWYSVVKTVGSVHDTVSTHVMLKPLPVINPTSNGPICSGNTLTLDVTPDSLGETYRWSGPNAFSSTLRNPSRINAPVKDSGIYKVIATFNGCTDSTYLRVVVDSTPALPTVGWNPPLCSPRDATHGDTLKLTSSTVTPGVTYSWSGPIGFVSTMQNPTIPLVDTIASGTYTVTARLRACTNSATVVVTIKPTPVPPTMASNAPICSGTALNLSATSRPGTTFNWSGPNGFTFGGPNPTIDPATTLATGIYSVSATLNGCTSDTAMLYAAVDSTPEVPLVSNNSPGWPGTSVCEGDTLRLFSSDATAGVHYSWAGPTLFTSTQQNPIIAPVTPSATGSYTVTAILGNCSSAAVTTVSITPTPIIAATSNSPVCTGNTDTLFLNAISDSGATFSWTGPLVFFSNIRSPYRAPVIKEMNGIYHVTAYLNGCHSATIDDTVVVHQTPPPPWVAWLTWCQYYTAPPLQAYGENILWYPTSAANAVGTSTAPVPSTATVGNFYYYATQTVDGCVSFKDSIKVTIHPTPVVTVSKDIAVCPRDSAFLTAADADVVANYHWTPAQYLNDTTSATVIVKPETNMTYTVVASNQFECSDTATVKVTVQAGAVLNLGDSLTLYPGESYQMNPQTNCAAFTWFPPAGLSSPYISNPLASPQISTKYIVKGVTDWGCVAEDSINIYVSYESLLDVPNAFAPGNGPNARFKIVKRGIAELKSFSIFDRWGVKVFETKDIEEGWDGTYNGKPQPQGVYIYQVNAVSSAGTKFVKQGNVTLLR